MYRGLSEFTKGGYDKAAKRFDPKDLEVDLSGKSFIVTGMHDQKLLSMISKRTEAKQKSSYARVTHAWYVPFSGANSGLGRVSAEELARLGGTVHLVCRYAYVAILHACALH